MASTTLPGGTFKLADDLILTRMVYGAMQLAGPHVFGPPKDYDGAIAVLREVVRLGINHIANRRDDALIDSLAEQGIGYVPFFPLGGFTPLQSETFSNVAARLNAKPMSVALAWLLQRSPNILLIPGTSSVEHLRENVAGAALQLPDEAIKELNTIAG